MAKSNQKKEHAKWQEEMEKKQASVQETNPDEALEDVELNKHTHNPDQRTKKRTGL